METTEKSFTKESFDEFYSTLQEFKNENIRIELENITLKRDLEALKTKIETINRLHEHNASLSDTINQQNEEIDALHELINKKQTFLELVKKEIESLNQHLEYKEKQLNDAKKHVYNLEEILRQIELENLAKEQQIQSTIAIGQPKDKKELSETRIQLEKEYAEIKHVLFNDNFDHNQLDILNEIKKLISIKSHANTQHKKIHALNQEKKHLEELVDQKCELLTTLEAEKSLSYSIMLTTNTKEFKESIKQLHTTIESLNDKIIQLEQTNKESKTKQIIDQEQLLVLDERITSLEKENDTLQKINERLKDKIIQLEQTNKESQTKQIIDQKQLFVLDERITSLEKENDTFRKINERLKDMLNTKTQQTQQTDPVINQENTEGTEGNDSINSISEITDDNSAQQTSPNNHVNPIIVSNTSLFPEQPKVTSPNKAYGLIIYTFICLFIITIPFVIWHLLSEQKQPATSPTPQK